MQTSRWKKHLKHIWYENINILNNNGLSCGACRIARMEA